MQEILREIKLHDKTFIPYIAKEEIELTVKKIANTIYQEYQNETPVFVGILSGVIMFMADFLKFYPGNCEVAFIKLNSYKGTSSSGEVNLELDFTTDITNRHVVILEDIVDTGNTLEKLYKILKNKPAKSIKITTLFFKPDMFNKNLNIDLIGMHIPNKFVVGYGLDYDGIGRNYEDLYQLKELT
jgi:hypoxanthine phosphoribosyltransferase